MFGVPGESFMVSWFNFIILVALVIAGLFVYKIIADIITTHLKNSAKSRNAVNGAIDSILSISRPLKAFMKVLGTVAYIAVCLIVIAYASS